MCGICGIVSEKLSNIENLKILNNSIIHRGPDDEGYYLNKYFCLGMRRLSIIDLNTGHQPISTNNGRYTIVFNGEIYNYKELKTKYLTDYSFLTTSDTEALLLMYEKFGEIALQYINGIFAFCIYDKMNESIFIARDKVGIKPLYYYRNGNDFLFSSEIKSFFNIKGIDLSFNLKYLNDFLSFGFIPSPYTIFKNVYKLDPGYYIIKTINKFRKEQYWKFDYENSTENNINYEDASNKLKILISDTVKMEMVSDVSIGSFLSGGLDSSIVTYEMTNQSNSRINTFTITFNNSRNDSDKIFSRLLSNRLNTVHNETEQDLNNANIRGIIGKLDEPFGITSLIPLYLNAHEAKKNVKVVLSGDGADEVFGGYSRYKYLKYLIFLKSIKLYNPDILNKFRRYLFKNISSRKMKKGFDYYILNNLKLVDNDNLVNKYISFFDNTNSLIKKSLFEKELYSIFDIYVYEDLFYKMLNRKSMLNGNDFLWFDLKTTLADEMLTKVDTASMLNSLEVRVPFLNHRLVEFAFSLPFNYKVNNVGKKILKDIYKDKLGKDLVFAKKRGFNMPIGYWLKNELKNDFVDLINSEYSGVMKLNKEFIGKEFRKFLSNQTDISELTFYYLYNLLCWYRYFKGVS
jgi:asparagine synthase (glutamine-hydrolysing)